MKKRCQWATSYLHKQYYLPIILPIVLFVICCYNIGQLYTTVMYADDFHYWANAAFFAGYDWSGMVRHDFYYSYGYSLLLAPLFRITQDGVLLFRIAIVENVIMLEAMFFFLYKIGRKIFPTVKGPLLMLSAFASCLYPGCIVLVNVTMSEILLYLVFVILVCVYLKITDKTKIYPFIIIGYLSVYMFMIHQRMLTVVIVSMLLMLILWVKKRISNNQLVTYFLSTMSGLLIHSLIKKQVQNFLYVDYSTYYDSHLGDLASIRQNLFFQVAGILLVSSVLLYVLKRYIKISNRMIKCGIIFGVIAGIAVGIKVITSSSGSAAMNNDFASIWNRVLSVFELEQIKYLIDAINGHFYYLLMSSALLVLVAVYMMLYYISGNVRDKTLISSTSVCFLFIIFSTAFTFLLSCVFAMGDSQRADTVMYGRYVECCIPVFIMCALCFLLEHSKEKTLKVLIASFAIAVCSTYFLSQRMLRCFEKGLLKETRFVSVNTPGVFWGMQDDKLNVWFVLGVATIVSVLLYVLLSNKKKISNLLAFTLLSACFVIVGKLAVNEYIIPQEKISYSNHKIVDNIKTDSENVRIFFMREPLEAIHISAYIQTMFPMEQIICLTTDDLAEVTENSYIICETTNQEYRSALEGNGFHVVEEAPSCVLYSNR